MAPSNITAAQRSVLVDSLVDPKPFYGEGIWSFPSDHLNLFLAKEPYRISLSQGAASETDLRKLAAACDPATFGVNQTDVLDESYRKAGKLDRADFSMNLDIVGSGLLNAAQSGLFGWEDQPRSIKADLYKLNVYGPNSFFKAHKDTPRGENMFGSLVLNFPIAHKGGILVLRHDGKEVKHDASKAAYTSPDQVSWVAFYSDVEHEVLPVKSGHRVTLTYNLHFSAADSLTSSLPSVDPVLAAFKKVMGYKTFFPNGGRLGFGLKYQYPVPADADNAATGFLQGLSRGLKGGDSALFRAAEAAGLAPKLAMAYEIEDDETYLLDHVIESNSEIIENWREEMEFDDGAERLVEPDGKNKNKAIEWIVPRNSNTRVKSYYMAYGNEASLASVYGDVVLIVAVPPVNQRA